MQAISGQQGGIQCACREQIHFRYTPYCITEVFLFISGLLNTYDHCVHVYYINIIVNCLGINLNSNI